MTFRHRSPRRWPLHALATLLSCTAATAALAEGGKLLLTGGVSTIDGVGGGGLVPWAVTSS
jgi:hypothetical protein